jgi:hypothetical protein
MLTKEDYNIAKTKKTPFTFKYGSPKPTYNGHVSPHFCFTMAIVEGNAQSMGD